MSKRSHAVPITSLQAHSILISTDLRQTHWNKIMLAMKILAVPSSMQKIAEKADMQYIAVARRMNELELDGLVEKSGKGLTETNRPCALYRLVNQPVLSQVQLPEAFDNENQLELF